MKNKLTDLNNHLFAQLERLSDEELEGDKLHQEIQRAQSVVTVASAIVNNASLALKAQTVLADGLIKPSQVPKMLGTDTD